MPDVHQLESVWDYPRPPRVESCRHHLCVQHEGRTLAETRRGWRVLETSHPPCYYFPPESVDWSRLLPSPRRSLCEFKGQARYWHLRTAAGLLQDVCWSYAQPVRSHAAIAGHVSFYAGRVDACLVDGELVQAQAGDFYGGWITSWIRGPFKGELGTAGW